MYQGNNLKRSYYAFGVFPLPLSFIVLCSIFVHVIGLQSDKSPKSTTEGFTLSH